MSEIKRVDGFGCRGCYLFTPHKDPDTGDVDFHYCGRPFNVDVKPDNPQSPAYMSIDYHIIKDPDVRHTFCPLDREAHNETIHVKHSH